MDKIIDLHIHTTVSDGILTPKEVIDTAVKNNVSVLSIADHDTIDAYTDELFAYAKEKNIELIPAVEISTKYNKRGMHVLGYNYDLNNQEFRGKLDKLKNARHNYLYDVATKLEALGYVVNVAELDKIEAVTKAHIALDVIGNAQNEKLLLDTFEHIPSKGEFIETIMNEGCPAYAKKESISPKEAADLIRAAGGKVVLAHPVAYKYEDAVTEEDIENVVREMGIDAIEANYVYVDRYDKKINECALWNEFAKKHNLLATIGSDFHSEDGLRPVIGLVGEDVSLTEEEINKILDYLKN